MSRQPEVLWAQRSDKVYLTVALPDAKDVSVKCEPQGFFTFSASRVHDESSYSFSLQLYGSIEPEENIHLNQYKWFEEELPKVNRTETPWLIILMEGETMKVMYGPWFVKPKVDVVFAGHVHTYERFLTWFQTPWELPDIDCLLAV